MYRSLTVVLILSIGVNALLFYRAFVGHPDYDFYGTSRDDAYLIKRHPSDDVFVIEHRDGDDKRLHRYTAKCGSTLTWTAGIVNPGRPMSETCIYLPSMVGKTVAAGMLRKEGDLIVFMAWTNQDTVQTADVLMIVRDEEVE